MSSFRKDCNMVKKHVSYVNLVYFLEVSKPTFSGYAKTEETISYFFIINILRLYFLMFLYPIN